MPEIGAQVRIGDEQTIWTIDHFGAPIDGYRSVFLIRRGEDINILTHVWVPIATPEDRAD